MGFKGNLRKARDDVLRYNSLTAEIAKNPEPKIPEAISRSVLVRRNIPVHENIN